MLCGYSQWVSDDRWHSLDVQQNTEKNNQLTGFKEQSELNKLGYKITGLNREQRWAILVNKAIPQLGVQNVVNIITSLVKNRKRQENGSTIYKHAIAEWEMILKD